MAISFPATPSANQTYTVGTKTWVYNGYAWDIQVASVVPGFNHANAAFDKANSANVLAYNTGIGANAWANAVGTAGNNFTISVGAASNNWANSIVGPSANNWANTKLSNTSNVWFAGNLNISHDLFVGRNLINVTQLVFNTSTNITPTQPGALTWSQDDSTLHFDMDSPSNVIGHIGQDLFYYVKNQTGSAIPKGTVVRFAGTTGASGRLLIAPAIANNSYPSKYTMGVTAASISNGADGFVIKEGKIRQIDTSMFSAGDILYVSPSTPGAFSNTIPTAPNNKITVAAVIHSDASVGSIEVRLAFGSRLNENENLELNGLTDGDLLRYKSANGRFENFNENSTGPAINAVAAFAKANAANVLAFNTGIGANAWANAVGTAGNNYTNAVGVAGNNYTVSVGASSNAWSNAIGTAGNNYTNSVGVAGNNYTNSVGTAGNNYTNSVGTAGNNYTISVGASSNAWANTLYISSLQNANNDANSSNSFAVTVGAASNTWANTVGTAGNNYTNSVGLAANNYAAATYYAKSGGTISGDVVVTGNLTISGLTTYANTQTLLIGDNILVLNADLPAAVAPSENAGLDINRGSSANASLWWNETTDRWTFSNGTVFYNIASNTDIEAGNAYATAIGTAGNNYTNAVGVAGNNYTNSVGTAGNNYTVSVGAAANSASDIRDTAGNNYTITVGASANAWANTLYISSLQNANNDANAANAWANTLAVSGNNYMLSVATSANIYAGQMVNAANAWANTKGGASVNVGSTSPTGNTQGALWYNTDYGRLLIWYTDTDSSQWVDTGAGGNQPILYDEFAYGNTNTDYFLTGASNAYGTFSTAYISTGKLKFNPNTGIINVSGGLVTSGNINATGTITATVFNSLSDINKKTNVQIIDHAIDKVSQLDGVTFNWKDNGQPSAGLIAQQLKEVMPELVGEDMTVNYSGVIGLLIECIKELNTRIPK